MNTHIIENYKKIKTELPLDVKMVAVSKTKPIEDIMMVYQQGHKVFGENKVQEISKKYNQLPNDIEWHFIGHLQRNKVKELIPFIHLIHSVDSMRLLEKINEEAKANGRIINCLLQVHIASEESKFGFSEEELVQLLPSPEFNSLQNIRLCGLMGMASYTDNTDLIRKEFTVIHTLFKTIQHDYFKDNKHFRELSIGMSGDYQIAVEIGSTIVRIGTGIFGERNY